jgi:heme oxygenase
MGDMFGGQMIKKLVDAPHSHLEFDNLPQLMATMREMLDDSLADEANVAFDWAIRILNEYKLS